MRPQRCHDVLKARPARTPCGGVEHNQNAAGRHSDGRGRIHSQRSYSKYLAKTPFSVKRAVSSQRMMSSMQVLKMAC
jgi:hypothetical protein